jgi:hypothetical protein
MTLDEQRPVVGGSSFGPQVRYGLRRSVASAGRRWLLVATLLVGVVFAVLVAVAAPVPSGAVLASPAQLLMSVLVPLTGVLLAHDLTCDPNDRRRVSSVVLAAALYAAAVALAGFVVCVVVAALTPAAVIGAPDTVLSVALGGAGLQVTAQLVGTGLGFLVRSTVVAFLGTIVLPLGLWLLLGAIGPLAYLQQWLTPFGATPPLLSGDASVLDVLAWVVVLVLWGGLLNVAGASRLGKRRAACAGAAG